MAEDNFYEEIAKQGLYHCPVCHMLHKKEDFFPHKDEVERTVKNLTFEILREQKAGTRITPRKTKRPKSK